MNALVTLCTLAIAAHAASIPQPAIPSRNVAPLSERENRQVYPAGYQFSPYAPLQQKAVYSPYTPIGAAPAYPSYYYPYASPYQNYPTQYYPLREESSGAEEGSYWGSYFSGIGNYFSNNYPAYYPSSWFGETESSASPAEPAGVNPSSEAEGSVSHSPTISNSPIPVSANKPNAAGESFLLKSAVSKPNKVQTIHSVNSIQPFAPSIDSKQGFAPAPVDNRFRYQPVPAQPQFIVAGQPQFYGHYSAFPPQQDPSKLTAANNGAISSYLFLRNQPQLPIFQQNQQKFAAPASFQNGNVKDQHQQFVQFSKELQEEQSKQVEKEVASSETNKDEISDKSDAIQPVESSELTESTLAQNSEQAQPTQEAEDSKKNKEDSSNGSTVNSPVAQAKPKGLAVAGEGGVADSSPTGTALVGKKGMALAAPSSIAIAGPDTPLSLTIETNNAQHKNKKSTQEKKPVARFSDARGYHIDYPHRKHEKI